MSVRGVRIGDLLELQRRPVLVDMASTYREIGVRSFSKGLFIKAPTTGADLGDKRVFTIATGDLVVSNVFAWEGAVAIAGTSHDGAIGSHRFMTWTPTSAMVDVRYLEHYFGSDHGLTQLRAASPGSAGRNRTLSIKNFEAIEVPLPDLPEQRRIADHLDRVARQAHELRSTADHHTATRAALIDQAFSGILAPHVPLNRILVPRSGEVVDAEAMYPIAGVYSFGRGLLYRESIRGTETKYSTLTRLASGDVVYSKLGAFEGAVAVVGPAGEGKYVSPEFPVFSHSRAVETAYLRHCLTSRSFASRLQAASTGVGARQKRVHPSSFTALDIPLPELDEQRGIAHRLDQLTDIAALTDRRTHLADALLPAARNEVFSAMR